MKGRTILTFAALCTVPFVLVLSNSMLIPVLPKMQRAMGISLFQVGLLITAFSIPAGTIIPLAGFLSDQYGRKLIMVPSLLIFGLGGVFAGLAALFLEKPYIYILLARILQGVGGGGTYQLAMALTGDIFQSEERSKALGILEAANGLGKVAAPLLGAGSALIFWYAPFFVYGVLAFTAALLVWFICEEPEKEGKKEPLKSYLKNLQQIFSQKGRGLGICFLAGMLTLFLFFGVLSYFSDLLESRYHIKGFTTGLYIAGPVLAMALTSYLVGTLLQRQLAKLLKPAVITGLALQTSSLLILALVRRQYVLFVAIIILGIGSGILLPSLNMLITSASLKERGLVTALYGTVRFFGAALGPPTVGLALDLGPLVMFLAAALAAALIAALALFFLDEGELLPAKMLAPEKGSGDGG